MKNDKTTVMKPTARRLSVFALAALLALAGLSLLAKDDHRKAVRYQQVNLVSDLASVASTQDVSLVNAWGISFSPTGPFWVSANGTGKALLYAVTNDALGTTSVAKQGLEVTIPGEGNVTGQVFNNLGGFNGDIFLFVSEDGTISGWRPALSNAAETLLSRTGAVYKGVALVPTTNGPVLLAANFSEGTLDAYGTNLTLLGQFTDPKAPAGYAPFNVQSIKGRIFVTFARQDDDREDDVSGPGHGLIDVFSLRNGKFRRFATGSDAGGHLAAINSPWGLALAPRTFGRHSDRLLIGNFGSGTIMAFKPNGDFQGLLKDVNGDPVAIEGLWGLTFGNGGRGGVPGTLYFSAGPHDESHGVFGSLEPVRTPHHPHDGDDDDDDQGDDHDHGDDHGHHGDGRN